jgi:hypothetical protein
LEARVLPNFHAWQEVACAYASSLGQAPAHVAKELLGEVFQKLEGYWYVATSVSLYSRAQVALIDAIVQAIVGDESVLGSGARRWLEEDEFLVRQRVHRDLRALMDRASH